MFFGGKGGVGKTTIANATALKVSAHASTLVVSTDPAHNVGHLWNMQVGDTPTTVRPGVDVLELDPARATNEHLDRKSTRLNSSHVAISYAVFCLKKKISTT